jgi:hypothetical protein
MEDKTFALLETMYAEFTKRFDSVEKIVNENSNHILRLENEMKESNKALFDGYKQTYEKLLEVEDKVDDVSARLDGQEVEIKVLRGIK